MQFLSKIQTNITSFLSKIQTNNPSFLSKIQTEGFYLDIKQVYTSKNHLLVFYAFQADYHLQSKPSTTSVTTLAKCSFSNAAIFSATRSGESVG
jgi:hypothetical protein